MTEQQINNKKGTGMSNNQFKNITPNTIFLLVIGLSIYLYQRSFGILYNTLPATLDQANDGQQMVVNFANFSIDLSYLTMSFIWPLCLCTGLYLYKRYALTTSEPFISKAVTQNIDLNIIFHIFVSGALIIHLLIYIDQISDALSVDPKAFINHEYAGEAIVGPKQTYYFIVVFTVSYCLSAYLFIRSFFIKRISLPS